jgi:hypothetical protein
MLLKNRKSGFLKKSLDNFNDAKRVYKNEGISATKLRKKLLRNLLFHNYISRMERKILDKFRRYYLNREVFFITKTFGLLFIWSVLSVFWIVF